MSEENNGSGTLSLKNDKKTENLKYWVWFANICGAGSIGGNRILERFKLDPEAIYRADLSDFRCEGVKPALVEELMRSKDMKEAELIVGYCKKANVEIITLADTKYPFRLKQVISRPILLYCRGNIPDFDKKLCIAVVGTRNVSRHGSNYTYKTSFDLARCGAVIVSGMARGVDTDAHSGAIDASGTTVAVLGCGIDRVYPSENDDLMKTIIGIGAVITEYKPGTPPNGYNFPMRNRIISGLCQATLVTEASETSGALITARCAEQQGRDIFAMPGNAGELQVAGSNKLLSSGKAQLAVSAYDILARYVAQYPFEIDVSKLSQHKSGKASPLDPAHKSGESKRSVDVKTTESSIRKSKEAPKEQKDEIESEVAAESPELGDEKYTEKLMSEITDDMYGEDSTVLVSSEKDSPENANVKKVDKSPDNSTNSKAAAVLKEIAALGKTEKTIYDAMSDSAPMSADDIIHKGFSVSDVFRSLTLLEVSGAIEAMPGGLYIKKKFK